MHYNKTYSSDHIYCMDVFRSGEAKKLAIIVPVLVLSHY